ncbi:MAG: hypothetical protein AB7O67_01950 [Vicinamibacterales bacterium]
MRDLLRAAVRLLADEREVATFASGLALVACGGWQIWPPLGCLIPGAILLWIAIPSRRPLVDPGGGKS